MKKQLLMGLLASIALTLSTSSLYAQCHGDKVLMFKPFGHGGSCDSKCVSPNKVSQYISQGWLYYCPNTGGWGVIKTTGKTNGKLNTDAKRQGVAQMPADEIQFASQAPAEAHMVSSSAAYRESSENRSQLR